MKNLKSLEELSITINHGKILTDIVLEELGTTFSKLDNLKALSLDYNDKRFYHSVQITLRPEVQLMPIHLYSMLVNQVKGIRLIAFVKLKGIIHPVTVWIPSRVRGLKADQVVDALDEQRI